MPQIYTKEEVDKLLNNLSNYIAEHVTSLKQFMEKQEDKLTKMYNELFSMSSDNMNLIHLLMDEKKKSNGVKSPYAR